jgi:hypothetical protein
MAKRKTRPFKKPFVWNGDKYPSITIGSDLMGISHGSVEYRLRQGYSCDADMKNNRPIKIRGVLYPNAKTAMVATGIPSPSIYLYFHHGTVIWDDTEYESIGEAADACGISPSAMKHRLKRGYTHSSQVRSMRRRT